MTTKTEIREWFNRAKENGATHMMVVCDSFDWEDYPVEVSAHEDVKGKYEEYSMKNMQQVMEVYNLSMDIESQFEEHRVFNF